MQIPLPHPEKKRALFVVDVQQGFTTEENAHVLPVIKKVIAEGGYALFVEATFHAPAGSLWDKQMQWTFDHEPTLPDIKALLDPEKTISIIKTTKSVFAAAPDLATTLREQGIEEIHVIGFDANDCVLVTAEDGFDAGFFTYVIEEATGSSNGGDLKDATVKILREVDMTNHSELIQSKKILVI